MKPYSNPALDKKFDEIERSHVPGQDAGKATTKTVPLGKASEVAPNISPIWYGELSKMNLPQPTWVVDRLVPDASITIISAPPAQYKTWLAFDVAIHVASGLPLFGQFDAKQTKVLIIDEESGLARARERLQLLGISDDSQIAIASYNNFKISEATAKSLIAYCATHAIGLVVFDSLTRIHNGDENSAKDMSLVMGDLKRLAQQGIAVLLIHHNRKPAQGQHGSGGANEMRGSGDILAACDVQLSVKRRASSNLVTVFQNKNRDAADLAPFDLEVYSDESSFRFEYLGNAKKQETVDEKVDEAITAYLDEHGQSALPDIKVALSGVAGETKIAKRLEALAHDNKLMLRKAAHGGKYYEPIKEQSND